MDYTLLYETVHGSRAYDLHGPGSDTDLKGVMVGPGAWYHGVIGGPEQIELDGGDHVHFEIRKFFKLAIKCNPTLIEVLWTDPEHHRTVTPAGERLLAARDAFLSRRAQGSFAGYALSQLKRIKTHRRWLLEPPTVEPTRAAFGLPQSTLIPRDQLGAAESMLQRGGLQEIDLSENFLEVLRRERAYRGARREWEQYRSWKKNRNPKRAALEAQFGYDCYTDDTEFLTDSGWRLFDDIGEDDKLATVHVGRDMQHRRFGTVEYQEPTERFDGRFTGNLYRFFAYHTEVTVTPNHRMLIRKVERRSGKPSEWALEEAARLPDTFEFLRTITPTTTRYSYGDTFKGLPIPPQVYMTLMGWFLSDGTVAFQGDRVKAITISQKKGGKLSWSMARFQGTHGGAAKSSLYEYERISSASGEPIIERILSIRQPLLRERIYEDCGHGPDKRIPRWVFGLSRRLKERLFDGMIRGDGTVRNTPLESLIYYSSSKGLADDVHELAVLCGWEASLWGPYRSPERPDQLAPPIDMYQVHVNKNTSQFRRLVRSRNIERLPVEDQRIVCFTVPNGTLITRKNGRVGIHGNSKHATHLVRLLRMGREILETGQVIVKRPDREELLEIKRGEWTYDQVVEHSEALHTEVMGLARDSPLPERPDEAALDRLCVEIVEQVLAGGE